jgi:hypothetical protein
MELRDRAREDALRRTRRQQTRLTGSILERDGSIDVTVIDLSQRGCLVRMARPLSRCRVVDVVFSEARQIHAKARVVDCSQDGDSSAECGASYLAGLEFLTLSAEDADLLRRLLDLLPEGGQSRE